MLYETQVTDYNSLIQTQSYYSNALVTPLNLLNKYSPDNYYFGVFVDYSLIAASYSLTFCDCLVVGTFKFPKENRGENVLQAVKRR